MTEIDLYEELSMLEYFYKEKGDVYRYVEAEKVIDNFPFLKRALEDAKMKDLAIEAAFAYERSKL